MATVLRTKPEWSGIPERVKRETRAAEACPASWICTSFSNQTLSAMHVYIRMSSMGDSHCMDIYVS